MGDVAGEVIAFFILRFMGARDLAERENHKGNRINMLIIDALCDFVCKALDRNLIWVECCVGFADVGQCGRIKTAVAKQIKRSSSKLPC